MLDSIFKRARLTEEAARLALRVAKLRTIANRHRAVNMTLPFESTEGLFSDNVSRHTFLIPSDQLLNLLIEGSLTARQSLCSELSAHGINCSQLFDQLDALDISKLEDIVHRKEYNHD